MFNSKCRFFILFTYATAFHCIGAFSQTSNSIKADYFFNEGNSSLKVNPNLISSERMNKSILNYSKAIEYNDKFWQAYRNRCKAYLYLKKYKLALFDINTAIRLSNKEKNPDLFVLRGQCHYALKSYKNAVKDFDYAIPLLGNPDFTYMLRAKSKWK